MKRMFDTDKQKFLYVRNLDVLIEYIPSIQYMEKNIFKNVFR